ncbi:MAG: division/cell wall cluster transcriptional repressor MraZ [Chitinophagaceae bacterium]|nr:division/cell wall cluster transcriptional repressor MraZ [Chitinophagaceae bacterium]
MIGLLGEFEATLDAKGRFLLPAGLKKQLPEDETSRFVINRGFEKCLALYPMSTWRPLSEKIAGLNEFDPKQRDFRRAFLNGATYVEPDTAGRLLLPPSLKMYAGLEKDIVLMATGDKIEIWDSNKYKQFFDSISSDALSNMGNQVLGGGNKNE